jgi:hypothetical protein
MKKTLQILLKHNSIIIIDTIVKSTHETNIKVYDFFEQDTPCLILSIEHDQLNTLLDLTKTRPCTLIYLDNGCGGYIFAAAAFSNNETEIPFFINTQFKMILFIPSSIGVSPLDIEKNIIMHFVKNKEVENEHQFLVVKTNLNPQTIWKLFLSYYVSVSRIPINHSPKTNQYGSILYY